MDSILLLWRRKGLLFLSLLLLFLWAPVDGLAQGITPTTLTDGVLNTAYPSTTFDLAGAGALSWSWVGQNGSLLPPGMSLSTAGVLTGTPTRGGTYLITVRATLLTTGGQVTRDYTFNVTSPTLTITSPQVLAGGQLGVAYNVQLTATGGSPYPSPAAPYTWAISDNPLPPGLTLSTSGLISGTPTQVGNYTSFIAVYDNAYPSTNIDVVGFQITVTDPVVVTTATPLPDAVRTAAYSVTFAATGGSPPYRWTQTAGTLPTGLTLANTGVLSGTPSATGTFNFTVTATDSLASAGAKAFTATVYNPIQITSTSPITAGEQGAAYSYTFSGVGGRTPYVWTLATGTLPSGLTLTTGGLLSGTPTVNGTFNFTVRMTDSLSPTGQTATLPVSLTLLAPITITTTTLPGGVQGAVYSQSLATTGGQAPLSWSVSAGALPGGLNLTAGVISGTITAGAGTYNFTARAQDALGGVATRALSIQVVAALSVSAPASMPLAVQGVAYSQTFTPAGGQSPYAWSIATSSSPPPGLTMSSAGVLSGTPTTAGTFPFTVQVNDSTTPTPQVATRAYSLTVDSAMTITTASPLPAAVAGAAYSQTLAVTGGTATYTWGVQTGTLPSGITLSAGGALSGTTTQTGTFNFTAQVTDAPGQVATKSFSLTVNSLLTITTTSLPLAVGTVAYSTTLAATGGTPTYVWTIAAGALPSGVTLSTAGLLSGTTTQTGSFPITVRVTDSATPTQQTTTAALTLVVDPLASITTTSPLPTGVLGAAYSLNFGGSGGTPAYTWSVATGSLPGGMALSGAGALTGTPNAVGTYNFTIRLTDSLGQIVLKAFSMSVATALGVTTTSLPVAVTGASYSVTLGAAGGLPTYSWSLQSGTLPSGITLTAGGLLSGTTSVTGTYPITVRVTDSGTPVPQSATAGLTLNVDSPITITTPSPLPAGIVGKAYSQTLALTGGTAPFTWTPASGLPPGLTQAGAVISGTPTLTGTFSFQAQVTDTFGLQGSQFYFMPVVTQLTISSTSPLPVALLGSPYTYSFSASGGVGPYVWTPVNTLPPGMSLSSGGQLTGTPSGNGQYTFTVQVTDATAPAQVVQATFVLAEESQLVIQTTTLPPGITTTPYSTTFSVTGGTGPYNFVLNPQGPAPPGLTLGATSGTLSGTPTAAGSYSPILQVTDAYGQTASHSYSLLVVPKLSQTTVTLPAGREGLSYSTTLGATGGSGLYQWTAISGVPPGLTLSGAGALTGQPTTPGSYSVVIQVADVETSVPQTATVTYPLTIGPRVAITTTSPLPAGVVGKPYSVTLAAANGTTPYYWSAEVAPPGMTLSSTGVLSGTPTTAGPYTVYVFVYDNVEQGASAELQITIVPAMSITTKNPLPSGNQNVPYSTNFAVNGGQTPISWTVANGTLPAGVTLSSAGVLAGTPTNYGTFNFTAQATDSTPGSAQVVTGAYSVTIAQAVSITTASPLPGGVTGQAYSVTLAASGGTPPLTWTTTAGALPTGWTLSSAGVLSGTTTTAATYNFTVQAADNSGGVGSKAFAVTVAPPLVITTASPLPVAIQNSAYTAVTLASTGGTGTVTWAAVDGLPPAGMTLSSAGVLSGTPTVSGTFNFAVRATDSAAVTPQTATKNFALTVDPLLTITSTAPLPYAVVGQTYSNTLASTGGTAPLTWTLSTGALPAGLTLSAAGVISGAPTAAGAYSFTVQVVDTHGQTVTRALTLAVVQPLTVTTTSPLPPAGVGAAYSQALAASGGTGPYSWSLWSEGLAPGLSLSAAGVVNGTPTTAGTYRFRVQVTDSSPGEPLRTLANFDITIGPPVTITTTSAGTGIATKPYSLTLAASGGTGAITWTLAGEGDPAWLSLTPAGVLSGTPPTSGTYSFTVRATDTVGLRATRTFELPVNALLTVSTTTLPDGVGNVAYTQTLAATGGIGPYTWSVSSGALPNGLTLNADGTLTGTPLASGQFSFTAQVKDASTAAPQTATAALSLRVLPPLAIVSTTLTGAQFLQPYTTVLVATGGVAPYNWTLLSGGVPGLTLSPAGLLSGTPNYAGTYTMVVRLGDTTPASVTAALQVIVAPPVLTISSPPLLPPAISGVQYAYTLAAFGAPAPYVWSLESGSLPPGIALSETGVVGGVSTAPGSYVFSARAVSGVGNLAAVAVKQFTLNVQNSDLSIVTAAFNGAVLGQPFAQQLQASGGTPPYAWNLASGNLPQGVTINPLGVASGIPGAVGSFQAVVRVADSSGLSATRNLTLTVTESSVLLTTTSLPLGTVGTAYAASLAATGGQPGYTFSLSNGTSLPQGLTLSPSGGITGTPLVAGTFNFAVTVQDTAGGSAIKALSVTIVGQPVTILTSALTDAVLGQSYTANLSATGGAPPYTWSASGLPGGLSVNSGTGVLSGSATATGPFTVTVTVTDSQGGQGQRSLALTVKAALLTITTPSSLGTAERGQPFSRTLAATGGAPPYTWQVISGNAGNLTLSAAGVLAGSPDTVGSFSFVAQATDKDGSKDTRTFSFTVTLAPLSLDSVTPPAASAGVNYSLQLGGSGGLQPYTWSATGLPEGLSIDPATGAITGAPTAGGPFTVVITLTDSTGQSASRTIVLNVTVPSLPPTTLNVPTVVQPLEQPNLRLNIDTTLPVPVEGEVRLTFTADGGGSDPAVQFATGGTTVRFTIPAGANLAQFSIPNMALQTGSVAGVIVLTGSFRAAGVDITPTPAPSVRIRIEPAPPGIRSVTAVRTGTGFTVTVVGFVTTREVSQATFRFNAAPGSNLQTSEITVPVTQLFTTWFADPQSQVYGSQFTFIQPFNVQGDTSSIASITVVLTNSLGASSPVTATLQ
jgi:hypothetical protein